MSADIITTVSCGSAGGSAGSQQPIDPEDMVDYIDENGDVIRVHHQRRSKLAHVPVEIMTRIGKLLPTKDQASLRLTCKHVESSLFREFSREFFSTKQFMLTNESLGVLVQISQHKNLGPRLNKLIIGLDCYDQRGSVRCKDENGAVAYSTGYSLQQSMLNDGDARDLLAQAIANLSGLQTIQIKDQDSKTRTRDGVSWRSYGWRKIEEDTGIALQMNHDKEVVSHVFNLTLGAIAQSGRQIPNLEVVLKHKHVGLNDRAFVIPPARRKDFTGALEGLESLHIDIDIQPGLFLRDLDAGNECVFLKEFLANAKNLRTLRMNFQRSDRRVCHFFLEWMVQQQNYKRTQGSGLFPSLERLELGFLNADGLVLAKLFKAFPNLTGIVLHCVTLIDAQLPAGRPNLWAQLISGLAQLEGLTSVRFNKIQQGRAHMPGHSYIQPHQVVFLKRPASAVGTKQVTDDNTSDDSNATNKPHDVFRKYTGSCVQDSLKACARDVVVLWPRNADNGDDSTSESDDDDDGDDDDDSSEGSQD